MCQIPLRKRTCEIQCEKMLNVLCCVPVPAILETHSGAGIAGVGHPTAKESHTDGLLAEEWDTSVQFDGSGTSAFVHRNQLNPPKIAPYSSVSKANVQAHKCKNISSAHVRCP